MKRTRFKPPYYDPPGPRRAIVAARMHLPEEVRAAQQWLATHRATLTFVSDDEGDGAIIHLWRVEGPKEIIATLPPAISAGGDWVTSVTTTPQKPL